MARLRLLSSRRKQIRLALKATMRLLTVAALYIYISLQIIGAAGKRKSAAEWNSVVNKNLDAVEESWKKGRVQVVHEGGKDGNKGQVQETLILVQETLIPLF